MIDSRYVVYYDLLLHLQEEEEKLEENMDEVKHDEKHSYHPNSESKHDYDLPHVTHTAKHVPTKKESDDRLSLDEVLDEEVVRMSSKSNLHK